MMKITGLSHLFKWENMHNWWLTKYFFAPMYIKLSQLLCVGNNLNVKITIVKCSTQYTKIFDCTMPPTRELCNNSCY